MTAPRIAVGLAKGVELLQVDVGDVGFLFDFAERRIIEILLLAYKAAGQRPLACKRVVRAANEQHCQLIVLKSEQDHIHRDGGAGMFVGVEGGSGDWHELAQSLPRTSLCLVSSVH